MRRVTHPFSWMLPPMLSQPLAVHPSEVSSRADADADAHVALSDSADHSLQTMEVSTLRRSSRSRRQQETFDSSRNSFQKKEISPSNKTQQPHSSLSSEIISSHPPPSMYVPQRGDLVAYLPPAHLKEYVEQHRPVSLRNLPRFVVRLCSRILVEKWSIWYDPSKSVVESVSVNENANMSPSIDLGQTSSFSQENQTTTTSVDLQTSDEQSLASVEARLVHLVERLFFSPPPWIPDNVAASIVSDACSVTAKFIEEEYSLSVPSDLSFLDEEALVRITSVHLRAISTLSKSFCETRPSDMRKLPLASPYVVEGFVLCVWREDGERI